MERPDAKTGVRSCGSDIYDIVLAIRGLNWSVYSRLETLEQEVIVSVVFGFIGITINAVTNGLMVTKPLLCVQFGAGLLPQDF
jgi:hypothetical protein